MKCRFKRQFQTTTSADLGRVLIRRGQRRMQYPIKNGKKRCWLSGLNHPDALFPRLVTPSLAVGDFLTVTLWKVPT